MTATDKWIWPSSDEINDFPDPLGFEAEWKQWPGPVHDPEGSNLAEIFVRELVQNSWDAIQDSTSDVDPQECADRGVTFREVELEGADAAGFVARYGLDEHAGRFENMSKKHRKDSRLDDSQVAKGSVDSLRVLIVSERWGTGMWGPWKTGGRAGVVSRLKSALIQTRSEKKSEASGGSWGHGKKGIANASAARTVLVYTCSGARADDIDADKVPITRRLLGVSYWRTHDLGERAFVGLGLFGNAPSDGSYAGFVPFENDGADSVVESLGLPGFDVRSPESKGDHGVTYVIVEPTFSLQQLAAAVTRNWWPLLLANPASLRVIDAAGSEVPCSPSSIPSLAPFVAAHSIALGSVEAHATSDRRVEIGDQRFGAVGRLGLTSDVSEGGWSLADPDTNASVVALIRNDMVIAYQQFPVTMRGKPPFIRGALVVDRVENKEASEGLKMAEPHLHNEWVTKASNSVPREYADLAGRVMKKLAERVAELRRSLQDKSATQHLHFPEFSRIWSGSKTSAGRRDDDPDPPRSRDHSIRFAVQEVQEHPSDPTLLRLRCVVRVALLPKVLKTGTTSLPSRVDLGWGVLEERGPVRDHSLTDVASHSTDAGVSHVDGVYTCDIGEPPVEFEWTSQYFSNDWRVVPDPRVTTVLSSATPAGSAAAAGKGESA